MAAQCLKFFKTCDGTCVKCPDSATEQGDVAVNPSHYSRWKIEPITFIVRNSMEYWRGNIIKYASRCGFKAYDGLTREASEILDLEKIKRYADIRINQIKGNLEL